MRHAFAPLLLLLAVVAVAGRSLVASEAPAADPAAQASASATMLRIRAAQYGNDAVAVRALLADIGIWGFASKVRSKAGEASDRNVQRIQASTYGWELLALRADGDAAMALIREASSDDKLGVRVIPFCLVRIDGSWRWLPNPMVWNARYHSLPGDTGTNFKRLDTWKDATIPSLPAESATAGALLERWKADLRPKP
jgi:hypothetical protein